MVQLFHLVIYDSMDPHQRLIIAMDAAFGMLYLHDKNIIHFDLKSQSFLVNMKDPKRPICKVIDKSRIVLILFFLQLTIVQQLLTIQQ